MSARTVAPWLLTNLWRLTVLSLLRIGALALARAEATRE